MHRINQIEGIGSRYADRLHHCGIDYLEQFLKCCASPGERKRLAERSGISRKLIMKWTNQADLTRIKGIGEEYSELLERAGVDTVIELAQRNARNLIHQLKQTNDRLHLVRRLPGLSKVERWVSQARKLPRLINY